MLPKKTQALQLACFVFQDAIGSRISVLDLLEKLHIPIGRWPNFLHQKKLVLWESMDTGCKWCQNVFDERKSNHQGLHFLWYFIGFFAWELFSSILFTFYTFNSHFWFLGTSWCCTGNTAAEHFLSGYIKLIGKEWQELIKIAWPQSQWDGDFCLKQMFFSLEVASKQQLWGIWIMRSLQI